MRMSGAEMLIIQNQIGIMRALKDLIEDARGKTLDLEARAVDLGERIADSETEFEIES